MKKAVLTSWVVPFSLLIAGCGEPSDEFAPTGGEPGAAKPGISNDREADRLSPSRDALEGKLLAGIRFPNGNLMVFRLLSGSILMEEYGNAPNVPHALPSDDGGQDRVASAVFKTLAGKPAPALLVEAEREIARVSSHGGEVTLPSGIKPVIEVAQGPAAGEITSVQSSLQYSDPNAFRTQFCNFQSLSIPKWKATNSPKVTYFIANANADYSRTHTATWAYQAVYGLTGTVYFQEDSYNVSYYDWLGAGGWITRTWMAGWDTSCSWNILFGSECFTILRQRPLTFGVKDVNPGDSYHLCGMFDW
jgi:hypothetical protein